MSKKIMPRYIVLLALVLVLASGCGKKAPLHLPEPASPSEAQ